ncbi:class I adenylate cyclase [Klebsiella pneumoniae]|uniref:class I adenylate cyclase n=1 Tax=Klebsiella pneumoniae TaxID=573 RepID=UPI00388FD173
MARSAATSVRCRRRVLRRQPVALYKIHRLPYKAVLKTKSLLLEAYSREYFNNRLLAKDIKRRLRPGRLSR